MFMKKTPKYSVILLFIFLVCVLYLIVQIPEMNQGRNKFGGNNNITPFENGWTDAQGQTVDLGEFAKIEPESDGKIHAYITLPDSYSSKQFLMFRSKALLFDVIINGQQAYSYHPQVIPASGKSYGYSFHSIPLYIADVGADVEIVGTSAHAGSAFIDMMYFGSEGNYASGFIRDHIGAFVMCFAVLLMGGILLILSFIFKTTLRLAHAARSLGVMALLVGTWSGMETCLPQFLTGNSTFFHALNYIILMFLPYPAVSFVNALRETDSVTYQRIAFYLQIIAFTVACILNYSGIMDFHESRFLFQGGMALTTLLILYMFYSCRQEIFGTKKNRRNILISAGFLLFMLYAVIELIRYNVEQGSVADSSLFLRIGFVLFAVCGMIQFVLSFTEQIRKSGESEAFKKLAFTDAMTGMGNRAAYMQREAELDREFSRHRTQKILCCVMDINDLKEVNDRFGHKAGDVFIREAAAAILASFPQKENCFRIGGDEFFVFLTDDEVDHYEEYEGEMRRRNAEASKDMEHGVPLIIATGTYLFDGKTGQSIERAERLADRMMYEHKAEMKGKEPKSN